jgi:uncharacterized membrane protein HdeD (DUF308 family)
MSEDSLDSQLALRIKQNAGLATGMGILVLVAGILALSTPAVAGLSVAMLVGFMLIMGGVGQLYFAYESGSGIWAYIAAALTVLAGGFLAFNPAVAATTLSIFLLVYFLASGVVEVLLALKMKPIDGWVWTLITGLLSIVLGVMIWSQFPLSGLVAIGVLLGIKLCFSGLTLIMLGAGARRAAKGASNMG